MKAGIAGIGLWLPERVRTNDDWPDTFKQRAHSEGDRTFNDIPPSDDPVSAALLARYLAREAEDPFLGGLRRHVADDSTSSSSVEVVAGRAALADAGVDADEVDVVLSYSVVPDRVVPPSGLSGFTVASALLEVA